MNNTTWKILVAGAIGFVCGTVACLAVTTLAGHLAKTSPPHWTSAQLADAGYATPDAALKTLLWGISHGDSDMFLASLSPEASAKVQQAWQGKLDMILSTFKRGLGKTTDYQILSEQTVNGEVVVDLLSTVTDGRTYDRKFFFKNTGGEWKCSHVFPLPEIDDEKSAKD